MFKLNVLNIGRFLDVVNSCSGDVNILLPTGFKVNINGAGYIQQELVQSFGENDNSLKLILEFENYTDYMKVMLFAISDNYSYCHD
ncbi:MAG TPA: hypothetical protein H9979_02265 [Candidatus Megamonas gallistercoris]|nr:hypothetical protein [Candidatus Megamonas gallistercoris]